MEITIRVRRSGGTCVLPEGRKVRRHGRLVRRCLGAIALGAVLLVTVAMTARVRAARDRSGDGAAPVLEVTSLSVRQAGGLIAAEGTVRNRSSETFEYVWVRADFHGADGHRVSTSDDALIETTKLGPGESASFRLYGVTHPAIARCVLEFSRMARVRLAASGASVAVEARAR